MGRKKIYTDEELKERKREKNKKRYQENKEKILEQNRKWRKENPEKSREIQRKWAEANPDKIKEKYRKWAEANPDYDKQRYSTPIGRANMLVKDYKYSDKNANRGECIITGEWMTENIFSKSCFYCDESDWHKLGCDRIDNNLPHTPDNVICSCWECNTKRGRKDFVEFLKEIGRLDKLKELKDKIIIADNVFVD